jgi:hypothetical protein
MRILLLAVLFAAASSPALADCSTLHRPQNTAGVMAAENAWVHALETKDVKALSCILAPGFMDMAWSGDLLSRTEILAALPKRPANGIKLSNVKIELTGERAIARGITTVTKPDGTLFDRVKFEDIFQYRDEMWRALTAQETLLR